jgi:hypothetical protein
VCISITINSTIKISSRFNGISSDHFFTFTASYIWSAGGTAARDKFEELSGTSQ